MTEHLDRFIAAAKQGFDAIACGDYTTLRSEKEIDDFLGQIHEEVSAELAAGRTRT